MVHNAVVPDISVEDETYEVRAHGELLRCEPDTCVPLEIAGMCHERASGRLFICEGSGV